MCIYFISLYLLFYDRCFEEFLSLLSLGSCDIRPVSSCSLVSHLVRMRISRAVYKKGINLIII